MTPVVTIAIPTFNRSAQVAQVVTALLDAGVDDVAKILVFDDGSSDATREVLASLAGNGSVRVEGSASNGGYAHALAGLFAACETEFLLATSDDDVVLVDGVRAVAAALRDEEASLISTRFVVGQATYRGRMSDAPIRPAELRRATNHAPGILYRVKDVLPLLPMLERRVERGCAAAAVYPQVVLAALLGSRRTLRWSRVATVREGHDLPSGIADSGGRKYLHPASRMQQILDFEELFESGYTGAATAGERTYWRALLAHHRSQAFRVVRDSLIHRSPELARAFDLSAATVALRHPRAVGRAWRSKLRG